jgi:hypothetical protein
MCKSGELLHSNGTIQCSHEKRKLENFLVKGEVYCLTSNLDSSCLVVRNSQNVCQQEIHASSGPCQTSKTGKLS